MSFAQSLRHRRAFRGGPWARRWVAWPLMALSLVIGLTFMVAPLQAEQQAWLAVAGFLLFLVANRIPGRAMTIFIVFMSCLVSMRYIYWRMVDTLEFTSFMQTFLGTGLLLAEIYAVSTMLLAYFQAIWPLDRKPVPLPEDPDQWPTIDVFIPSYNEPLEIVKPAIYGALAIDWPRDKMNVYLLDDGRRDEFRRFCEQVGCNYLIRADNKGAKAGNINAALKVTNGEFICIFDCDHVATRAFLQLTVGWLLRDRDLAMVQTPHHFYSPDPFERNLASGQRVPNEGLLFYGLVQQGNDLWNAAFFCGSCAVIRREALLEVGGVPTETVTEDCHCSLKMQRRGWRTAYLRVPLAAGLATERLMLHIGQRMRWGRGMIQILRIENPMLGAGLKLYQRCCYFMSQFHFLFPLPRFVFLTAPLAFLLFGESIIAASPLAIVAYAGPHILHSVGATSRLSGHVRHSFWSEIYETVLALYLIPVMLATLLDPKKGKFNVTDKGGTLQEGFFDLRAVGPNMVLALALIAGLLSGIYGMTTNNYDSLDFQAYALNFLWAALSFVVVLAGLAVGRERRQVRERARVGAVIAANVVLADGRVIEGETMDLSLGGAAVAIERPGDVPDNAAITLELDVGPEWVAIPAEVLRWQDSRMQVRFAAQTLHDEGNIVRAVLGRADAWVDWDDVREDKPLRSLGEVARSIGGLFRGDSQFSFFTRRQRRNKVVMRTEPAAVDAVAAEAQADTATDAPAEPTPAAPGGRRPRGETTVRRAAAIALALALGAPGLAQAQVNLRGAPPPPTALQPGPQGLPLTLTPQSPGIGTFGAPATQSGAVPLQVQNSAPLNPIMPFNQVPSAQPPQGVTPGAPQGAFPGSPQGAFQGAPQGVPLTPFGQPAQPGQAPAQSGASPFGQPGQFPGQQGPIGTANPPPTGLPPLPVAQPGFQGGPVIGSFGAPTGDIGSTRTETRTLRQLGLRAPMQMRGTSDLQGVLFGVRGDEVVTGARLVLQGATSPALIPEYSQISMALNEQFVGVINPDRNRPAFGPLEFPINPVFFADLNRMNFRFTGRYTLECNDPLSGLLWANISDLSTLQLTLERLPLQRDLARLPEPFFDPRLLREPLLLPVVVPEAVSNESLQAAATVASWFAVQADYRGASFPVSFTLPQRGNAVVIAGGAETIPGLALPRFDGPTLALVPNPTDRFGLILVVGGRNGEEAAQAAVVLAGSKEALAGEIAVVQPVSVPPRQPYDAPRWVRSDRPVRLGELVDPSELQAFGYAPGPISVPFRTAPDLYTWRGRPLPVELNYRSPPGPIMDVAVSRLDIALNDIYLRSLPLRDPEAPWPLSILSRQFGQSERMTGRFGLPPYLIFGMNELQMRFDMRPLHRGDCIAVPADVRAGIDPDSTIDLSDAHRFTTLPNLAFFSGSGFPFTRMADFSDTAAVLPDRPNEVELTSFLTLMGRLAAHVGHASTGIRVVRAAALDSVAGRDLLVIGTLGRQPALERLLRDGPVTLEGNRLSVALPDALEGFRNLFLGDEPRVAREQAQALLASPGEGLGILMGFESPLRSGKSVVALTGTTPQGLEQMLAALRDPEQAPRVQGDLAILSAGRITGFSLGNQYTVGTLPPYIWPQYFLQTRPDLLLLLLAIACAIVAVPAYWALRRRAAIRLRTRTT
ncbi:UDP-forming cellulose synthase catalytic subunit [Falsiroseomonas tokyonensis]|uniref:Cellulose synthase catalytic subunit [UDP-forming] n=2 Tax=Falsiroseomonas tokyonensis TaxID=430521 RepID=A0ABV7BLH5_9PROT|nr:UDP-forming cellulose synthase catalytic subunit [Falsiroseomonas tokyonensis]MBU8536438.1 UDP-forming cellulose synthase catalytic subunit [Falsiroseomonas tokyonensis]